MSDNAGKTVRDILKLKKASIRTAALPKGSPSWDDILSMTWEEVMHRAKRREPGYKTIKKFLSGREHDR